MTVRHTLAQLEVDAIDLVRLAFLGAAGGVSNTSLYSLARLSPG